MKLAEQIIAQLSKVCGIDVSISESVDCASDGQDVWQSSDDGKTYFSVAVSGKYIVFYIDGCGEDKRAIAALAREYALTTFVKKSGETSVREFLDGTGDVPFGVHVGKADYYVFALHCSTRQKTLRDYLSAIAGGDDFVVDMTGGVTAFCKIVDGSCDYRSAGEFAEVLRENLAEEIEECVKIGVGGVAHGMSELPQYYGYAKSALMNGAEYDPNNDIYSYKEYALIKALSELSPVTMDKYVKTVLDKNYRAVLTDDELMSAADAFLKQSLNISEASRSMYVHRNTLIYRLDKIEKMTGLNIRNFNDAMTFRAACLIYKILK